MDDITGVNVLDKFLKIIDNGSFIYSINLLDSNLNIGVPLEQMESIKEPDILQSTSYDEVLQFSSNSSTNNFIFKTAEPIKHDTKWTTYEVTTLPFIGSPLQKKRKNVSQLDTWKIIAPKCELYRENEPSDKILNISSPYQIFK